MTWARVGIGAFVLFAIAFVAWAIENRRRRRHPVSPGLQSGIELSHSEAFELYHNALSLCSMKVRVCLAELRIPYRSHPVDLVETGAYENIRAPFLRINPAGTVPVLVHHGHPIYESHEQIRYAARVAPEGSPRLVPQDPALLNEMESWIDRSSLTEDPLNQGDLSAGNAAPGLTIPLFATMIEKISYSKIAEGLLFHFDKFRPFLFTLLKICGIGNLHRIPPIREALARSRDQMGVHLDALEAQLSKTGGPWLLGDCYSLADVSWLVIFERLRQTAAIGVFMSPEHRPAVDAYWRRLQERSAYQTAIRGESHPLIEYGRERIEAAKNESVAVRDGLEGPLRRSDL